HYPLLYSFPTRRSSDLFAELLQKETDISEIVVLSTCNRTEIYFSQDKYDFQVAAKLVYKTLKRFKAVKNKYWNLFYAHSNEEAVDRKSTRLNSSHVKIS